MAGGVWSATDRPVLPGFYMAFRSAAAEAVQGGSRGTVVVPVRAHWGPVQQFVAIGSEKDAVETYTTDVTGNATAYTTVRMALLGGAKQVLAYRVTDGTEAASALTLTDSAGTPVAALKLEAKFPGSRGNAFKATVQTNPVDSGKKEIKLFEGTQLLRTFTFVSGTMQAAVEAINTDTGNLWIRATKLADGNGTLAAATGVSFAGGNSGLTSVANANYLNALAAFETQAFDAVALDGVTDPSLLASFAAWVTRLRNEGKGIVGIVGGSLTDDRASDAVSKAVTRSASFNHEGIVNVGTGAVLADIAYGSAQVAPYVAGLIAGQPLNASTTYASTPFADAARRWTRAEQEQAVRGGVFLFIHDGKQVKALRGINSLTGLREGQSAGWKKIRTIRVMDAINGDLQRTAETAYIGKVNNTEEGRLALIGACKQYLQSLAQASVIEASDYDVYIDTAFVPEPDQVYLKWEARLTDVMEQLFSTFVVR